MSNAEKTSCFGNPEQVKAITSVQNSYKKQTCDAAAKAILSNRIVLANILKYSLPEFAKYDAEDLAGKIDPNKENQMFADISDIESTHSTLATIKFDIKTHVDIEPEFEFILNVEAQNALEPRAKEDYETYVKYSLAKRGVYYVSRMISDQLSTGDNNYQKLKKCYSIWIIFKPGKLEPQVLSYKLKNVSKGKGSLAGQYDKDTDLMQLVFIIADIHGVSKEAIQRLIRSLFITKGEDLSEFIPVNKYSEVYEEVQNMDNLGEIFKANAIEEGMAQGMAQGEMIGVAKTMLECNFSFDQIIDKLINTYSVTYDEAMNILDSVLHNSSD